MKKKHNVNRIKTLKLQRPGQKIKNPRDTVPSGVFHRIHPTVVLLLTHLRPLLLWEFPIPSPQPTCKQSRWAISYETLAEIVKMAFQFWKIESPNVLLVQVFGETSAYLCMSTQETPGFILAMTAFWADRTACTKRANTATEGIRKLEWNVLLKISG